MVACYQQVVSAIDGFFRCRVIRRAKEGVPLVSAIGSQFQNKTFRIAAVVGVQRRFFHVLPVLRCGSCQVDCILCVEGHAQAVGSSSCQGRITGMPQVFTQGAEFDHQQVCELCAARAGMPRRFAVGAVEALLCSANGDPRAILPLGHACQTIRPAGAGKGMPVEGVRGPFFISLWGLSGHGPVWLGWGLGTACSQRRQPTDQQNQRQPKACVRPF